MSVKKMSSCQIVKDVDYGGGSQKKKNCHNEVHVTMAQVLRVAVNICKSLCPFHQGNCSRFYFLLQREYLIRDDDIVHRFRKRFSSTFA